MYGKLAQFRRQTVSDQMTEKSLSNLFRQTETSLFLKISAIVREGTRNECLFQSLDCNKPRLHLQVLIQD